MAVLVAGPLVFNDGEYETSRGKAKEITCPGESGRNAHSVLELGCQLEYHSASLLVYCTIRATATGVHLEHHAVSAITEGGTPIKSRAPLCARRRVAESAQGSLSKKR